MCNIGYLANKVNNNGADETVERLPTLLLITRNHLSKVYIMTYSNRFAYTWLAEALLEGKGNAENRLNADRESREGKERA